MWWGLRSGSSPRKNGSSARALTMTAAADVIRATVHNRVDNQVRGASVANHRHRRSYRSRPVCLLSRVAARTVAPPQPHRRHFADRAAAHRRVSGRGPVRGVKSEGGKSGLKALRAPSPRIRHRAYGPAGYRPDSWLSFGSFIQGDGVLVSTIAGGPDFPRRRTEGPPGESPLRHVETRVRTSCSSSAGRCGIRATGCSSPLTPT